MNNFIASELINGESLAIYKPALNSRILYLNNITSSEVLAMAAAYRSLKCECEVILISALCYKIQFLHLLNYPMCDMSKEKAATWEAEKMEPYDE